ncbi:serine hydrolase [Dendronalium sp. ChiSLP03b]|uniref:serine hydrolase n=1 Tax=Dendronalium sp. ChiSLP03b TaxID=3075381 RepID=UPI002AD4F4EE|nr:serine hydrolase [Dendronalium sp. ChiSLP03b]MDZ8205647.1 serine hydrolase [Dendronalium sp. ChiSLP03b]
MPQQPPSDRRNQIIAELQSDLAHAHRIIQQQHEQINQLKEQLQTKTRLQRDSQFVNQEISNSQPSSHSAIPPNKTLIRGRKRVFSSKKSASKLTLLQFTSLVAVIVALMTGIGFALMRRQNSSPSEQTKTQSQAVPTVPKPQASISPTTALTVPSLPPIKSPPQILPSQIALVNSELVYNPQTAPNFQKSPALQSIVDEIVSLAISKGLPKKPLSITLIDTKNGGTYGAYQQDAPRFPASVVKMFWMVYLYAQIKNRILNEADFTPQLNEMIKRSDNNAASDIIDAMTKTESGKNLDEKDYESWLKNRKTINVFFQNAGYKKININQKTYPITDKKIYEPQGFDLKMRGDPKNPIRNKITTQQAARLLYEIYEGQAISSDYSQRMFTWLSIDSATRIEKRERQNPDEFNPVRGYFSESLPEDVNFGGKAGWTSTSRQEAAYIQTKDGKAAYILVVFAEDRAYASDKKIFPEMSRLVFERMTK